jgi:tetratricopeptide (TPR) repeat protein
MSGFEADHARQAVGVLIPGRVGRIAGDIVGGDKIVHGFSIDEVLDALDRRGLLRQAEAGGLERDAILGLARRLRPDERLDMDAALRELEGAVAVALDVIARGERGSNLGDFVDAVLRRVGTATRGGAFDEGAAQIDAALAELDAAHARSRIALLEEAVRVDILRRDAAGAAARIEALAAARHPASRPAWRADCEAELLRLLNEGQRTGLRMPLEIAIALSTRLLDTATDGAERAWALMQLGSALLGLGTSEAGTKRLGEAVAALTEAVTALGSDGPVAVRAAMLVNLSDALRARGEREEETGALHDAVAAAEQALDLLNPTEDRDLWVLARMNLGSALAVLGEREQGTVNLSRAARAYADCLQALGEGERPLHWGVLQSNMGNVLRLLGQRGGDIGYLKDSVAACRAALRANPRATAPQQWAQAQRNLAASLVLVAEFEPNDAAIREAIAALEPILDVWREDSVPNDWATVQINLANAHRALGMMLLSDEGAEEAAAAARASVAASRAALRVWIRDADPMRWALAQGNLADGLTLLGAVTGDPAPLLEAVAAQESAIAVCDAAGAGFDTARVLCNRSHTLRLLGRHDPENGMLEEAVSSARAARRVWRRDTHPVLWANATENLARAVVEVAWRTGDRARWNEALGELAVAAEAYAQAAAEPSIARVRDFMAQLSMQGAPGP